MLRHLDVSSGTGARSSGELHDPLTGLPNRQLLHDRLTEALDLGARASSQLVVVAGFDLDQFTRVNDTWGHAAGDELLRQVAARLEQLTSGSDTTARAAVDEFVVVHPGVASTERALEWAQQLATAFDEPFVLTASGGQRDRLRRASTWPAPTTPPTTSCSNLDAAVRAAKQRGPRPAAAVDRRPRTRRRDPAAYRARAARGHRGRSVRAALPAASSTSGSARSSASRRCCAGATPTASGCPTTSSPIAEDSGLIVPLGGWVVERGLPPGGRLGRQPGSTLDMAVNLSARQVSHPDTIATIERGPDAGRASTRTGCSSRSPSPPSSTTPRRPRSALDRVSALGARVAIDDFGTGYSSLLYLKRYPIQALKVDRTFVSGMGISDDDDAIVASVVSLARAVGAVCIAEGVETEEQHAALRVHWDASWRRASCSAGRCRPADLPALVADCDARLQRAAPPRGDRAYPHAAQGQRATSSGGSSSCTPTARRCTRSRRR